jgi:hypothetical protein
MTFAGLLWANRCVYLMLLLAFGLIIVAVYQRGGSQAAGYVALPMLVLLLRDGAALWRTVRTWPAVRDVIDWDRLKAVLDSDKG